MVIPQNVKKKSKSLHPNEETVEDGGGRMKRPCTIGLNSCAALDEETIEEGGRLKRPCTIGLNSCAALDEETIEEGRGRMKRPCTIGLNSCAALDEEAIEEGGEAEEAVYYRFKFLCSSG